MRTASTVLREAAVVADRLAALLAEAAIMHPVARVEMRLCITSRAIISDDLADKYREIADVCECEPMEIAA